MSTFKEKKDKKKKSKTIISNIDLIHQKNINNLISERSKLKEYQDKINLLKQEDNYFNNNLNNNDIKRKAEIKEEIVLLNEKINKIINNQDEMNYLYNTADILSNYYDILDDKNDIINTTKIKTISEIFDNNSDEKKDNINKSKLLEEFLLVTEGEKINKKYQGYQSCPDCHLEKEINIMDGTYVCRNCGHSVFIQVSHEKSNILQNTNNSTYAYKRESHFQDCINQFQGNETTEINEEVFHKVHEEMNKYRINPNDLDAIKLRHILKKLHLNNYYENIPFILSQITKKEPPKLSKEQKKKLDAMFQAIQEPFNKFKPTNRKNSLSYKNYLFHKFCELLEFDELLPYFPLLKDRTKLEECDQLWKKICEYLDWEFISSI